MLAHEQHKFFAFISALIFISIMSHIICQESYSRLIPQQSYDTKSKQEFTGNTRNYSTNNASTSQVVYPNHIPSAIRRPRPLSVPFFSNKEECLPILRDLHVKSVPEDDCDQPYITINPGGRLGNELCQYASLYLLRHVFGVRVSIKKDMRDFLSKMIKNIVLPLQDPICYNSRTESVKYDDMYMKLYSATMQAKTNAIDNLITKPVLSGTYYVYDAPGPRSLLLAYRDQVRSILRFKDEVVKQAIDNIDKALKPFNATYHDRNIPIITVHVRRTDYTGYVKATFNLTQLDELYFTRAFEFYKTRLKQPVFLVLSDDPVWCKQKLQAKDVMVIASGSPPVDMAVMSLGDHHVTSYGTYSFTGALLGRGHITHPIGHNRKYNLVDCVHSPFFHHISRDTTYEVDNSNVVL